MIASFSSSVRVVSISFFCVFLGSKTSQANEDRRWGRLSSTDGVEATIQTVHLGHGLSSLNSPYDSPVGVRKDAMDLPKPLKFIHITKTGGTSVEDAGYVKGFHWGRHHKEYGWWHGLFPKKSTRLKEKYDWFTIVRNPFSRMVSEFHCKWGGVGLEVNQYTTVSFNKYIQRRIRNNVQGIGHYIPQYLQRRIRNNVQGIGHYIPQYLYIDDSVPIRVLRFENLTAEFNELMNEYGYNVSLVHSNNRTHRFTEQDFSPLTLQLIQTVYASDFETFGYSTRVDD